MACARGQLVTGQVKSIIFPRVFKRPRPTGRVLLGYEIYALLTLTIFFEGVLDIDF